MRNIILVHGFGSDSRRTWSRFQKALTKRDEAQGWTIAPFDYPTKHVRLPLTDIAPDINRLAQALRTHINNQCNKALQIVLCGHSLGGLIIRKYLVEAMKLDDALPPRLGCICFSTPNNGADLAALSALLSKDNRPADQMRRGSEFLKQLNSDWSNLRVVERIQVRFVVAAQDKVVDSESAQGDWGTKNLEVLVDRDHDTVVVPTNGKDDLCISIVANMMSALSEGDASSAVSTELAVARFEGRLTEIDKAIAGVLPKGIRSPVSKQQVPFESKQLLQSLVSVGMPVTVAFEVVNGIQSDLEKAAKASESVSTRQLRGLVADAIHSLAPSGTGDGRVDQWMLSYARRYGHSEDGLTVVRSGDEHALDYAYLKEYVIPEVIHEVTKKEQSEIDKELITGSAVTKMASTLLHTANNLGIYKLRHDSLLGIALDTAVKPPHPWFVRCSGLSDSVKYDLDRASKWMDELHVKGRSGVSSSTKHAIGESLHHSASAILGFYGAFLGVGYLAPLSQLIYRLSCKEIQPEWTFCHIQDLVQDLSQHGVTRHQLKTDLCWMSKRARSITANRLQDWLRRLDAFNKLVCDLTGWQAPPTSATRVSDPTG